MCLILFAWKTDPDYPLVLAANRDEFHHRPAQPLHWWQDKPNVLAGRDLQAGGTWLGANRSGRVAAVTNYREEQPRRQGRQSRGEIVTAFLMDDDSPYTFSRSIDSDSYAGFSLLTADNEELCYVSNRGDAATLLSPGIYGLSNASLDTPWPKLRRTRDAFWKIIEAGDANETSLMRLMEDRQMAPVDEVETGLLPFTLARAITAPFIVTPEYGTRCTTILLRDRSGQINISERRFDSAGRKTGDSRLGFTSN